MGIPSPEIIQSIRARSTIPSTINHSAIQHWTIDNTRISLILTVNPILAKSLTQQRCLLSWFDSWFTKISDKQLRWPPERRTLPGVTWGWGQVFLEKTTKGLIRPCGDEARALYFIYRKFNEIFLSGMPIGNPGSLCVTRDITQVNYREHMRRSLGLKKIAGKWK